MNSLTLAPPPSAASFSPDAHRPMTVAAPTCLRVLVAEDQPLLRRLMVRTIEQLGHEVVGAEDGAQAWNMFMQRPADVVITDWLMPEMDGLDLCRRLRAEYTDTAPYVILASVLGDSNDVQNGLEAGPVGAYGWRSGAHAVLCSPTTGSSRETVVPDRRGSKPVDLHTKPLPAATISSVFCKRGTFGSKRPAVRVR
jgi:CheY-like chemotaxis protein